MKYIELCTEIKRLVKQAKTKYLDHLSCQMSEGNTKPLYNYIQRNSGRSNNITGLSNVDTCDIPDEFARHFASVFTKSNHDIPTLNLPKIPKMREIYLASRVSKLYY